MGYRGRGSGVVHPCLVVGLVLKTFSVQAPTPGGGAHSQGPPVGGEALKAEHHHHIYNLQAAASAAELQNSMARCLDDMMFLDAGWLLGVFWKRSSWQAGILGVEG